MIYSKEQLDQATNDMIELCKQELAKGNTTIPFNLTIDGKEYNYYLKCQEYIDANTKYDLNYYWDRANNPFI